MKYYRKKKTDKERYTNNQPCWTCKNACGGCSWSREFKPVDNWIAKPCTLISNGEYADTYKILYCPQWERG